MLVSPQRVIGISQQLDKRTGVYEKIREHLEIQQLTILPTSMPYTLMLVYTFYAYYLLVKFGVVCPQQMRKEGDCLMQPQNMLQAKSYHTNKNSVIGIVRTSTYYSCL